MLTPIGEKTLDFILKSLSFTEDIEQQFKIIKLMKRTSLLFCSQAEKLIDHLNFKNSQSRLFRVIFFSQIYENIIDKENFTNIKNKLEDPKEIEQLDILIKLSNTVTLYDEYKNFDIKDYDESPNIYIDKIAKIKWMNDNPELGYATNLRYTVIPLDEFYDFLNEAYTDYEDSRKLCGQLKIKFENFYISTNNVMDILNYKNKKPSQEFRRDIILEIYPYLIDPQNIERLINNLVYTQLEFKLREKLLTFANYNFGLKAEVSGEGSCCCVIY